MKIIDNTSDLLGDNLKVSIKHGSRLRIAASCFSIYAFEALQSELSKIESFQFVFTAPTFVPNEVTDRQRKERREFFIPKLTRENGLYGTEFEIQLRNKLTQRAVARECAEWIRKKAQFKSNTTKAPMQQLLHIANSNSDDAYMPISGFTAVDLGYQRGDAVSNFVTRFDESAQTQVYLDLFDQIWNDPEKASDVTSAICDHIESVYQENSPQRIYFIMLYNIFQEFLEDVDEDVLPKDLTGYRDSLVWNKLFNFQRDAATGIINKLETYNGCILADSVGLGKTFTALAVIKYYELRNRAVLVLCPKKLADNWRNYNSNLTTNIFTGDRFNYDVLCHTDLSRTSGESFGIPLNRVNWGNYDLVVIDESHNFRNNEVFRDRETRYQKLMNNVIRSGVKSKVLMLSATPVNNRFLDLRNQLALAYEGQSDTLSKNLKTQLSVEEIFRRAQSAFNSWSKLPPEDRTAESILEALDFDFFELLDAVTIARSRKHIENFYDTRDIGRFPERLKPISHHCPITGRDDVMSLNEIFKHLTALNLAVYAPLNYILPSRLRKYEELYDTQFEGGRSTLRQKLPRHYRNPFLARAMSLLNMIDTMGIGIHDMYARQARRYFPLPDYDLSERDAVTLTVHGRIVDQAYSEWLMQRTDLPLTDILALDRVQKKLPISQEAATRLRRARLIEGRKPNLHVSAPIADATSHRVGYIKSRSLDDHHYQELIIDFLRKFGSASRKELDELLWDKLSDISDDTKKRNKIGNLISKLRMNGQIVNKGSRTSPAWQLKK